MRCASARSMNGEPLGLPHDAAALLLARSTSPASPALRPRHPSLGRCRMPEPRGGAGGVAGRGRAAVPRRATRLPRARAARSGPDRGRLRARRAVPEMLRRIRDTAAQHDDVIATIAHAGDGNLHPLIIAPEGDEAAKARAKEAFDSIVDAAAHSAARSPASTGWDCSRRDGLRRGAGTGIAMAMQRAVKDALDPLGDPRTRAGVVGPPNCRRRCGRRRRIAPAACRRVPDGGVFAACPRGNHVATARCTGEATGCSAPARGQDDDMERTGTTPTRWRRSSGRPPRGLQIAVVENQKFADQLPGFAADDWAKPTDCPLWDVRASWRMWSDLRPLRRRPESSSARSAPADPSSRDRQPVLVGRDERGPGPRARRRSTDDLLSEWDARSARAVRARSNCLASLPDCRC